MLNLREAIDIANQKDEYTIFNKVLADNIDEIKEFIPNAIICKDSKFNTLVNMATSFDSTTIFSKDYLNHCLSSDKEENYEDMVKRCLKEQMVITVMIN